MGHVDGRSPGEVVFGARMAETAYRDAEARRLAHGEAAHHDGDQASRR